MKLFKALTGVDAKRCFQALAVVGVLVFSAGCSDEGQRFQGNLQVYQSGQGQFIPNGSNFYCPYTGQFNTGGFAFTVVSDNQDTCNRMAQLQGQSRFVELTGHFPNNGNGNFNGGNYFPGQYNTGGLNNQVFIVTGINFFNGQNGGF